MVNCSGVAARDLVPDPAVVPVRGQVVIAANPGIEEFFISRDEEPPWIVYMFPHGEHGPAGRHERGRQLGPGAQNLLLPNGSWLECAAIDPRLRGATILGHRVGLRPYRPEVRLESEPFGGGVLWHNYGHGGAGISLSWGCAAEITAAADRLAGRAERRQPGRRDHPVGVLAQLGDLGPVRIAVQPDADPAPAAYVRRAEEPLGRRRGELVLGPGRCGAPQVRELVIVVAVRP